MAGCGEVVQVSVWLAGIHSVVIQLAQWQPCSNLVPSVDGCYPFMHDEWVWFSDVMFV